MKLAASVTFGFQGQQVALFYTTFPHKMKAHHQTRTAFDKVPLSQQPQLNDMMCTAATRVSLPISMRPLSARPSCLVFEETS